MPEINEIVNGKLIGRKDRGRYILKACPTCGKERWIQLRWSIFRNNQPVTLKCRSCLALERNTLKDLPLCGSTSILKG